MDATKTMHMVFNRLNSRLVCTGALCYRSKLNDTEFSVDIQLHKRGARRQSLCGSLRYPEVISRPSKLQEDTHFRVLRLLQKNPEMSQRALAKSVGVSVGGIHYVLNALVEKGLVKLGNFTSARDKRRYAYVLTAKGVTEKASMTRRFVARKMKEYEALKAEIDALTAEVEDAEPRSQ